MTMAYQREAQPILNNTEREALFPTELTTDDVIILGEDTVNESSLSQKSASEHFQDTVKSELNTIDSWLSFKVKNELVAQIYTNIGAESSQINIAAVQQVITDELQGERDKNLQHALRLNEVIPIAASREEPGFNGQDFYWKKDVENLQQRMGVHREVTSYIKAIQASGDEGLYDLTETYIQRTLMEAQDEVLHILMQQKQELENRDLQNKARIAKLMGAIGTLETELEHAHDWIVEHDTSQLDQELMAELEKDANSNRR
jgi:hypothetical protein